MPLYDYRCVNYHTTESRQDRDTEEIRCPVCRKRAIRVITTAPGVAFKGKGWTLSAGARDGGYSANDPDVVGYTQEQSAKLIDDVRNGKEPDVFNPRTGKYENDKPAIER